jgi:glucose dehydrogenase
VAAALLVVGGVCMWNPWHLAVLYRVADVAELAVAVAVLLVAAALALAGVALHEPVRRRWGALAVAALARPAETPCG